jgi:antitoxin HicB
MPSTSQQNGKRNMSRHKSNKHRGSDFDDFLREEGIYDEVCAEAAKRAKRALAENVAAALKKAHKSVAEFAREMNTSRAAVTRLLDAGNYSVSLKTLAKVASALRQPLTLKVDPRVDDTRGRLPERRSKPARSARAAF